MSAVATSVEFACLDVLLVDDVPEARRLLRTILDDDARFRVVGEAVDGVEGVELAGRLEPDLILLDVVMPRLSGLEALPRIRQAAPRARVVVLSSSDNHELEDEVRLLGAVGHLDKGLGPDELVDSLLAMAGTLDAVEEAVEKALAEARSQLAAEVTSARSARRFVERTLRGWDAGHPAGLANMEVVKLLVSELVTNAVIHAHSEVEVIVQLRPASVHIEVLDRSPRLPVVRSVLPESTSGRGMALVSTYSSAWGTRSLPGGKAVWFEVARGTAA